MSWRVALPGQLESTRGERCACGRCCATQAPPSGSKELWLLEEDGHCDSYFADREAYCKRVDSFFEECL